MAAVNKDTSMANATVISALADAMRDAAKNEGGATTGFVGVNMAQNVAGSILQQTQQTQQAAKYCPYCGQPVPAEAKFCPFCGKEL